VLHPAAHDAFRQADKAQPPLSRVGAGKPAGDEGWNDADQSRLAAMLSAPLPPLRGRVFVGLDRGPPSDRVLAGLDACAAYHASDDGGTLI